METYCWRHLFYLLVGHTEKNILSITTFFLGTWHSQTPLSTPCKHMAHHRMPKSATYIHLHTPTHANRSYTILLFPITAPPYRSCWCSQYDGTLQHNMKINTSPNDIRTYQLSHSDAVYLGILVHVLNRSLCGPNNILFNVLCHFIVFFLCEFPALQLVTATTMTYPPRVRFNFSKMIRQFS